MKNMAEKLKKIIYIHNPYLLITKLYNGQGVPKVRSPMLKVRSPLALLHLPSYRSPMALATLVPPMALDQTITVM